MMVIPTLRNRDSKKTSQKFTQTFDHFIIFPCVYLPRHLLDDSACIFFLLRHYAKNFQVKSQINIMIDYFLFQNPTIMTTIFRKI